MKEAHNKVSDYRITAANSRKRRARELRHKKLMLIKTCIVALTMLAIVAVSGVFIVDASSKQVEQRVNKYYTSIPIKASMTLTDIAEEYCTYGDKHEYINNIMKLNNMESDTLYAGQNLLIMYYSPADN